MNIKFLTVLLVLWMCSPCIGDTPEKWISKDNGVVFHTNNLAVLIDRLAEFPIVDSPTFQLALGLMTEGADPLLRPETFLEVGKTVKKTVSDFDPKEAYFAVRISDGKIQWNLFVEIEASEESKQEIKKSLVNLVSGVQPLFFVNRDQKIEVPFFINGQWLVVASSPAELSDLRNRVEGLDTKNYSISNDRRYKTVRKRFETERKSDGRLSIFADPSSLRGHLMKFGLPEPLLEFAKLDDIIYLGVQLDLFGKSEEHDEGKLETLVGINSFATIAIPRRGIYACIEKPIDEMLPVHDRSIAMIAIRLHFQKLLSSIEEFLDSRIENSELEDFLTGYGVDELFSKTFYSRLEGTIASNLFESHRDGSWRTIRSIRANNEESIPSLADILFRQRFGKKSPLTRLSDNNDRKVKLRIKGNYTVASSGDWIFFGLAKSVQDYVEGFNVSKQKVKYEERVKFVRNTFKHEQSPFLVSSISPRFLQRWTSDIYSARNKIRKDDLENLTKQERQKQAVLMIKLAFYELIGHQVFVASDEQYGIHASGVVFKRQTSQKIR